MDIEYLLLLQGLREAAPEWLNQLLEFISELAIGPLVFLLPAAIFWGVSKRAGSSIFWGLGFGSGANALVKNTACVYRPWIRDARVQSSLMKTATGYSFPSGHTTKATALYGGVGLQLRRRTGKLWPCVLCLVPALITGFARNWVGAHTPQDVVVGFVLTFVLLLATLKLMDWVEANPQKDALVALIVVAVCAAILVYVALKPYPEDYAADGSLIVDGHVMNKDAFDDVGLLVGVALAWLAERRFVGFTTEGVSIKRRIVRVVVGCVVMLLLNTYVLTPIQAAIPEPHAARLFIGVARSIAVMFLYPAAFNLVERRLPAASSSSAKA